MPRIKNITIHEEDEDDASQNKQKQQQQQQQDKDKEHLSDDVPAEGFQGTEDGSQITIERLRRQKRDLEERYQYKIQENASLKHQLAVLESSSEKSIGILKQQNDRYKKLIKQNLDFIQVEEDEAYEQPKNFRSRSDNFTKKSAILLSQATQISQQTNKNIQKNTVSKADKQRIMQELQSIKDILRQADQETDQQVKVSQQSDGSQSIGSAIDQTSNALVELLDNFSLQNQKDISFSLTISQKITAIKEKIIASNKKLPSPAKTLPIKQSSEQEDQLNFPHTELFNTILHDQQAYAGLSQRIVQIHDRLQKRRAEKTTQQAQQKSELNLKLQDALQKLEESDKIQKQLQQQCDEQLQNIQYVNQDLVQLQLKNQQTEHFQKQQILNLKNLEKQLQQTYQKMESIIAQNEVENWNRVENVMVQANNQNILVLKQQLLNGIQTKEKNNKTNSIQIEIPTLDIIKQHDLIFCNLEKQLEILQLQQNSMLILLNEKTNQTGDSNNGELQINHHSNGETQKSLNENNGTNKLPASQSARTFLSPQKGNFLGNLKQDQRQGENVYVHFENDDQMPSPVLLKAARSDGNLVQLNNNNHSPFLTTTEFIARNFSNHSLQEGTMQQKILIFAYIYTASKQFKSPYLCLEDNNFLSLAVKKKQNFDKRERVARIQVDKIVSFHEVVQYGTIAKRFFDTPERLLAHDVQIFVHGNKYTKKKRIFQRVMEGYATQIAHFVRRKLLQGGPIHIELNIQYQERFEFQKDEMQKEVQNSKSSIVFTQNNDPSDIEKKIKKTLRRSSNQHDFRMPRFAAAAETSSLSTHVAMAISQTTEIEQYLRRKCRHLSVQFFCDQDNTKHRFDLLTSSVNQQSSNPKAAEFFQKSLLMSNQQDIVEFMKLQSAENSKQGAIFTLLPTVEHYEDTLAWVKTMKFYKERQQNDNIADLGEDILQVYSTLTTAHNFQ